MVSYLPTLIPFFIIVVLPLGVAGQNIGLGVALFCLLLDAWNDRGSSIRSAINWAVMKQFLLFWLLIILPITLATLGAGNYKEASRFFWGYLYVAVIPVMGVVLAKRAIREFSWYVFVFVVLLMGSVALSQMIFPWKFESGEFVSTIRRAQGFYSHPLTFAYVCIFGVPWCFARLMKDLSNGLSWVLMLSVVSMILCSQSVTVIAVSSLVALASVICLTSGKKRVAILGLMLTIGSLTVMTSNPISQKIKNVLSGERGDHETTYPDDRMAFWHAHWEMFKDAPVLGHGTGLEQEDRAPFYEKIGLGYISRMYEAHNMYLQFAVEGGFVPALTLLALLVWLSRVAWLSMQLLPWERFYFVVTPLAFLLSGLTQNAFQDSEVRYAFSCFVGIFFWRINKYRSTLN